MGIHSAKAAWLRSLAQPTRPHSKPGKVFPCTSMMTTRPCRSWKLCARSKLQASRLRWPDSTDLLAHNVVQLHGFAAHSHPLQLLLNKLSWPCPGALLLPAAQTSFHRRHAADESLQQVSYASCVCRVGSETGSRPSSVRMGIRGDRVGMATKAALEPSQLETHITSLMRASFGRLKVLINAVHFLTPAIASSFGHRLTHARRRLSSDASLLPPLHRQPFAADCTQQNATVFLLPQ